MTGIYKIQSVIKPERCYVGSAVNIKNRWGVHLSLLQKNKHYNPKLQNHLNKYGKIDLIFIIVELCFPEFLTAREQYYINKWKPYFNICPIAGSNLGCKMSEEYCRKMSERQKGNTHWIGKHHSKESKQKISKSRIGEKHYYFDKHFSEEHKRKIRESCIGINKGENNGMYGKHHSEEARKRIGEASRLRFKKIS